MAQRRALIIAPLYGQSSEGLQLPLLPGASIIKERLTKCLETYGNYEVDESLANTFVKRGALQNTLGKFFDCSGGQLLLYFYGHGCLRHDMGVLATSDASPNDEGVLMLEVVSQAMNSSAKEVVLIFDCCHAGAVRAATPRSIPHLTRDGRAILAACSAHQHSVEAAIAGDKKLGVFSACVLDGLEGKAAPEGADVNVMQLTDHITREFSAWGQSPIVDIRGASQEYSFIITSGFVPGVNLNAFCALFGHCKDLIEEMGQYKKLHDDFQELEIALRTITSNYTAERLSGNPQEWGNLQIHIQGEEPEERGVDKIIQSMLQNPACSSLGHFYTEKLRNAAVWLQVALEHHEFDDMSKALNEIYVVIPRRQSRINSRLCETARDLPLPKLVQELRKIHDHVARFSRDSTIIERLGNHIEQMAQLEEHMFRLREEHDLWQSLDDQLRVIESYLVGSIENKLRLKQDNSSECSHLEVHELPILQGLSNDLFLNRTAGWVSDMRRAFVEMQTGLRQQDGYAIVSAFDAYRSLAITHFKAADEELLEVCGKKLPQEVGSLGQVLRKVCGKELPEFMATQITIGA